MTLVGPLTLATSLRVSIRVRTALFLSSVGKRRSEGLSGFLGKK